MYSQWLWAREGNSPLKSLILAQKFCNMSQCGGGVTLYLHFSFTWNSSFQWYENLAVRRWMSNFKFDFFCCRQSKIIISVPFAFLTGTRETPNSHNGCNYMTCIYVIGVFCLSSTLIFFFLFLQFQQLLKNSRLKKKGKLQSHQMLPLLVL